MTMRKHALSGLKWTAGAKFGGQIVTWGITLMVMRLLSPEDYGLLAMATVFIAFMLMLAEAGLTPALIQKKEIDEASLRQAFGIIIVINLSLLVVLNLLASYIASFFGDERLIPILRVLSLQFLLTMVGTIPDVLLHRELKFKKLSLIYLTAAVSSSVLTLILALSGYGIWSLVFGTILASGWRVVAVNLFAPFFKLPHFSLLGMRSFIAFGGTVTISRLLWFFFNQADIIIVGKLLGQEMLGFYSVAMHLASLPVQRVSAIVKQVAFPVFSRFQHDREELCHAVIKAVRILSLVAFPVLWGISSIAHEIILIFLGQKWQSAILPLQLLTLMMPLRMVDNFFSSATDAFGRPDINMKNLLFASCVMSIAFLVGSQWGIIGVAISWVAVYPIVFLNYCHSLRVMGLRLRDLLMAIAPALVAAVGMYAAIWSIRWLFVGDVSQLMQLMAMLVTGVLTYGGLTLCLNRQGYREVLNIFR